jgi:hypothetical protein
MMNSKTSFQFVTAKADRNINIYSKHLEEEALA